MERWKRHDRCPGILFCRNVPTWFWGRYAINSSHTHVEVEDQLKQALEQVNLRI